jgi:O-antigen/teichoic acid export membrane protein
MTRSLAAARAAVAGNFLLLKNSAATALGSLLAAALGFLYWWMAARTFAPQDIGAAAALISIMGLVGLVGEAGFGTLLVGETLRYKGQEHGLISAASLSALTVSAGAGFLYFDQIGSPAAGRDMALTLLLVCGSALTGLALVLDQAYVGLLRSTLQMYRNAAFAVLRLLLLIVAATTLASGEVTILLTWVAALAASIAIGTVLAWRKRAFVPKLPNFILLLRLVPKVVDHHLLNLASQASTLIMPPLVSLLLSPTVNAAFYPMWMMLSIASLVPASLTIVLFTVANANPERLPRQFSFSLRTSAQFAIAIGLAYLVVSQPMLRFFGPAYPEIAGASLKFLGFSLFGISIKYHYIALVRLRNQMRLASLYLGVGSCLEVGMAAAGSWIDGLQGLTLGYVLAVFVQAAVMARPVLAVAREAERT